MDRAMICSSVFVASLVGAQKTSLRRQILNPRKIKTPKVITTQLPKVNVAA
jgi:phage regulator Rha-like protein